MVSDRTGYLRIVETGQCYLGFLLIWSTLYSLPLHSGIDEKFQEIFKMLPYVVTIVVLIITSFRKKRENQPPASLGESYFREER